MPWNQPRKFSFNVIGFHRALYDLADACRVTGRSKVSHTQDISIKSPDTRGDILFVIFRHTDTTVFVRLSVLG